MLYRKKLLPLFALLTLGACTPLIGPKYDWSHASLSGAVTTDHDALCRQQALEQAGDRPRNKTFNYGLGEAGYAGHTEGDRDLSRQQTTIWTQNFGRAIRHCMAHLGYVDPRWMAGLPESLQTAVKQNQKLALIDQAEAIRSYLNVYLGKTENKALALSPLGAWAWASGRDSIDIAHDDAVKSCNRNAQVNARDYCTVLNINGKWISDSNPAQE